MGIYQDLINTHVDIHTNYPLIFMEFDGILWCCFLVQYERSDDCWDRWDASMHRWPSRFGREYVIWQSYNMNSDPKKDGKSQVSHVQ